MYFQSLDPGLSQYPFETGRPPVSRILVAEHGACSKEYRHDGSRCILWTHTGLCERTPRRVSKRSLQGSRTPILYVATLPGIYVKY